MPSMQAVLETRQKAATAQMKQLEAESERVRAALADAEEVHRHRVIGLEQYLEPPAEKDAPAAVTGEVSRKKPVEPRRGGASPATRDRDEGVAGGPSVTTLVKDTTMGPYETAHHIPDVNGHELSPAANRHSSIPTLNEAITGLGHRARPSEHLPRMKRRFHGRRRRHPHGHLPRQPAVRDVRAVRQAGRHRLPPHLEHLHRAVHPLHPVRRLGKPSTSSRVRSRARAS